MLTARICRFVSAGGVGIAAGERLNGLNRT